MQETQKHQLVPCVDADSLEHGHAESLKQQRRQELLFEAFNGWIYRGGRTIFIENTWISTKTGTEKSDKVLFNPVPLEL